MKRICFILCLLSSSAFAASPPPDCPSAGGSQALNYSTAINAFSCNTVVGGGVNSFSAGTTGFTPNTATTGAVTLAGVLNVANGGTGTSTALTQGSVVFAGASGTYAQDNANFYYNPTGYSSGPTLQIGPSGSNPNDAVFEVYAATAGNMTAHFHNNGIQSTTGGAIVNLNSAPTGTPAAIASGNRLGSLQWGGTYDNTLTIQSGAAINAFTTQNWTSTHAGSKLVFNTVPNNSLTRTTALTLDQDQSATFAGALSVAGTTTLFNGSATAGVATVTSGGVIGSVALVPPANGGTGVNNGTSTITVGGNTAFSGAYTFTGTLSNNTSVTFPTSGTLATTASTVASFSAGTTGFTPSSATTGAVTLAGILGIANGGTNASTASGTSLDNITGFSSTGFLTRTGSGTYAFQSTTNGITLGNIAQSAANTMLGNWTGSTANVAANAMPSCSDSGGNHLNYVSGTGITCGTSDAHVGTVTSVTFTGDGTVLSSTPSSAVTTSGTVTAALANAGAGTVLGNATGSSAAPTYTSTPTLTTSVTVPTVYGGTAAGSTLTLKGTSNGSPSSAYVLLNPAGGGNVGIGVSSPLAALQVSGIGYFLNSSHTELTFGSSGNNFPHFYDPGLTTSNGGIALGGSSAVTTDPSTATMFWNVNNNYVGIGTTSPAYALQVLSTTAAQATFTGYSVDGSYAAAASGTIQLGTNTSFQGRIDYSSNGNTTWNFDNTYDSPSSLIQFRTRTAGTPVVVLGMSGGGNVGVGGASLNYRFESDTSVANDQAVRAINNATTGTNYGIVSVAIGTGASSNRGLYVNATGATTNQELYIENLAAGPNNYAIYSPSAAQSYFAGTISTGTSSTSYQLNVGGGIAQTVAVSCATGVVTNSSGEFSGCVASDRSLKTSIKPFVYDPTAIGKLQPVTYYWIDKEVRDGQQHAGFVAQDVGKVVPTAMVSAGKGLSGVDPNAMNAVLTLEVQALRKRLDADEAIIAAMQAKLTQ